MQLFDVMERKLSGVLWNLCARVTGCDLCEIERVEGENAVDEATVVPVWTAEIGEDQEDVIELDAKRKPNYVSRSRSRISRVHRPIRVC